MVLVDVVPPGRLVVAEAGATVLGIGVGANLVVVVTNKVVVEASIMIVGATSALAVVVGAPVWGLASGGTLVPATHVCFQALSWTLCSGGGSRVWGFWGVSVNPF